MPLDNPSVQTHLVLVCCIKCLRIFGPKVLYKSVIYLRQWRRYMFLSARPSSIVCVQDYSKMSAWIWMKCCVSTDVGTWKNWLTFEPNPDHRPDAGCRKFSSPIAYALQQWNFFTSGKSHARTVIGGPVEAATHVFEASKDRCWR